MNIQWFPGHMTRAQRMIEDNLKLVDAVCEILDARIPASSRNPDIDRLAAGKPRLVILNRSDLADPEATARWRQWFQGQGISILETDARTGRGVSGFVPAVRSLLHEKLKDYEAKGQAGRPLRVILPDGAYRIAINGTPAALLAEDLARGVETAPGDVLTFSAQS